MPIYRIKLNPDGKTGDAESFHHCRENGLIGFGWSIAESYPHGFPEKITWEDYQRAYPAVHKTENYGLRNAARFREMPIGSFCWIRHREDPRYAIAKVNGEWFYDTSTRAHDVDIVNARRAEWAWVDDQNLVPGAVVRAFAGRGAVFQAVYDPTAEMLTPALFSLATGDSEALEKLKDGRLELWSLLDPWDYEDAVGLFLQVAKGFLLPPSFCHDKNTRDFEYFVVDRQGTLAAVQVKSGAGVFVDCDALERRAREAGCSRLYILNMGENSGATAFSEIIPRADIEDFLLDSRNRVFLTPRIRFCVQLAGR